MNERTDLYAWTDSKSRGEKPLFTHEELACRLTGVVLLATGFAEKLIELRLTVGKPMTVNSCCRSRARNEAVGGHPKSLHVYEVNAHGLDGTAAIDIAKGDAAFNMKLVTTAMELGWSVGVNKGFFHFDRRDFAGLPQNVFGY